MLASTSSYWHANFGLRTRAAPGHSLFLGMPSLRRGLCIAGGSRRLRLPLSSQYSVPKAQRSAAPLVPSGRSASPALDVIFLDRSVFIDKEVITRTSGKRLGYINEMYVDPQNLQVVSFYLRQELLLSLGRAEPDSSHFHLRNLMQVGDVVLVHDEQVLMEPPADEYVGFVRLVGARVRTENGNVLGKVRDYVFDPDSGQISSILYDPLGVPKIPQKLVTTYSLGWQNIKAVGPSEVIVFSGSEARAVKENEGVMTSAMEGLVALLGIGSSWSEGGGAAAARGGGSMDPYARLEDPSYRESEEYRVWYQQYGAQYEEWSGKPLPPPPGWAPRQAPQQVRRAAPAALPAPQSRAFNQALQPQQQPQQQRAVQGQPWQLVQETREAVPAGWGGGGQPPQQQQRGQAAPPPQQQRNGWQQQQVQQQQGAADVQFPIPSQQPRQQPQQQPPRPAAMPPAGGSSRAPQPAPVYPQQPMAPGPYAARGPPPQQQVPPQQQRWAGQPPTSPGAAAAGAGWQAPPASGAAPTAAPAAGNPTRAVEPDAVIQGGSGTAGRAPQQPAEFRSVPGSAGRQQQRPTAGAQGMPGPGPAPSVPQQAPQQFRAQPPPQAPEQFRAQPPPQAPQSYQ